MRTSAKGLKIGSSKCSVVCSSHAHKTKWGQYLNLVGYTTAKWIVFGMMDVSEDNPTSQALTRFLAERPDLFQQKRLIVFAFNAPYFLVATNISKLTAYYGLYSKIPSFVDAAARLAF